MSNVVTGNFGRATNEPSFNDVLHRVFHQLAKEETCRDFDLLNGIYERAGDGIKSVLIKNFEVLETTENWQESTAVEQSGFITLMLVTMSAGYIKGITNCADEMSKESLVDSLNEFTDIIQGVYSIPG